MVDEDGWGGPGSVHADDGSRVETVGVGGGVGDVPPVFDEGGVGRGGGGHQEGGEPGDE